MEHRSYRGKVLYLSDGMGEMGREWFTVTIQPDGTRTMRAQCEMDDDCLLRDVVITVDADWCPLDAFVRLSIKERFFGSAWFRFSDKLAECEAYTAADGRVSQRMELEQRTPSFGTHPVHNDAWRLAKYDKSSGELTQRLDGTLSSSGLPNGGSGPLLTRTYSIFKYIGPERVSVSAGEFDTEHFQLLFGDFSPIDVWAYGEDCIPVRLRWDHLAQTYELAELDRSS